jgi:hypothetical protein
VTTPDPLLWIESRGSKKGVRSTADAYPDNIGETLANFDGAVSNAIAKEALTPEEAANYLEVLLKRHYVPSALHSVNTGNLSPFLDDLNRMAAKYGYQEP